MEQRNPWLRLLEKERENERWWDRIPIWVLVIAQALCWAVAAGGFAYILAGGR
jgi:fatty acid desaturase